MWQRRSVLSELLQIQQYLASRGLEYVTPVTLSPSSETLVIEVPRDRLGETASNDKTSRRQLTFIAKAIEKKFGRRVIVTIRDAQALDDIGIALRAVLKREFPKVVADVHVSFINSSAAVVWVESATIADPSVVKGIERATGRELSEFGVACQAFDVVAPLLPEPSTTAILRSVKVHAPAALGTIIADLGRRGFSCPSQSWLSYKLDSARKRGLVVRDPVGRFALTGKGLDVVPWNRSASSSDVERMLTLARRKEW